MTIRAGQLNLVNGLKVWPVGAQSSQLPYVTSPTVRQLDLLERAINACSYDWNRYSVMGLGSNLSLLVNWVNPEFLYYGHIGTTSLPGAPNIPLPGVGQGYATPAYAPLTRPNGHFGDYGGAHTGGNIPNIYLLNTLDQDPEPYGGSRFYMETVIRLLGTVIAYRLFTDSASQRDRLARCFTPVDRPDTDLALPIGTGGYPAESMLRSSQWYFESAGINGDMNSTSWAYLATTPVATPWETRLLEATGETFKDMFLPKEFRRHTNRTLVKLKPTRRAWDTFAGLYQAEIPAPRDGGGLSDGIHAGWTWQAKFHPLPFPGWEETTGYTFREAADIDVVDLGSETFTLEIFPGTPTGLNGKYTQWSIGWSWAWVERPSELVAVGRTRGAILPFRAQFPSSHFNGGAELHVGIDGIYSGQSPVTLGPGFSSNRPDTIYHAEKGYNAGTLVFQWHKWRATMPTGPHPRFPAGDLRLDGVDAGTRRSGRRRVGAEQVTAEQLVPPSRPPASRPHSAQLPMTTGADRGTVRS